MWLHHSMFSCSQDCLSITFQSINGMIYIMTLLSIWLLFSVMPPKSHPPIIEASDEGFYDGGPPKRWPSWPRFALRSSSSSVVKKNKSWKSHCINWDIDWPSNFSVVYQNGNIFTKQKSSPSVPSVTFWSTRKMKTWSQTLPVVETQPEPTDVKIILNNRQMIPLISFGTSEENLKWF